MLNFFSKSVSPGTAGDMAFIDRSVTIFNQIKESEFMKGKCLSRSLALQFLLRRKAIDTDLVIGCYTREGILFAHAWLEKDGQVLNDHPIVISKYKTLLNGAMLSNLKFK